MEREKIEKRDKAIEDAKKKSVEETPRQGQGILKRNIDPFEKKRLLAMQQSNKDEF
jgi:hypothetical protein